MAWFKVDDALPMSSKVGAIPRKQRLAAVGLWTLAGAWSAGQLQDGFVPAHMLEMLCGSDRLADLLVSAGLWEVAPGGYRFHDWGEYQPSREDVEAKRAARSAAGRKGGLRSGASRRAEANLNDEGSKPEANASPVASTPGSKPEPRPVPSRPIPLTTPDGVVPHTTSKRGSRIPEPFVVTSSMRTWAAMECPSVDVDRATVKFTNYWRAKTGRDATKLDWLATWRNWLMRDNDAAPRRQTPMERAEQTMAAGRMVAGRMVTTLEVEA